MCMGGINEEREARHGGVKGSIVSNREISVREVEEKKELEYR